LILLDSTIPPFYTQGTPVNIYQASRYGDVFAQLIEAAPATEIAAGQANKDCYASLQALSIESAFAEKTVLDHDSASACLSGIWLLHNYLDQSHAISQDLHSCTGSFWHGIMHRREPDYSNSAYWFRKVGEHSVFGDLVIQLSQGNTDTTARGLICDGQWDPCAFIDLCAQASDSTDETTKLCQQVTSVEWQLLFDYCYHLAITPI
jgi:hypothetical protein